MNEIWNINHYSYFYIFCCTLETKYSDMEILILFFSLLAIENLQRYFIFNVLIVNFAFFGNFAWKKEGLQSVFPFSLGCWHFGFCMVLLLLRTLFQDEKIIAAKDLNWNKTNSGFKFMLFCESQARFSTQVFSLFSKFCINMGFYFRSLVYNTRNWVV
jgi:hypothetical protein